MDRPYSDSNTVILQADGLTSVKLTANHLVHSNGLCSDRYVFLFDVSGSMNGQRIENSKLAAAEFYASLCEQNIKRNKDITNKYKVWDHYCIGSFSTKVNWLTRINQTNRNGKNNDKFIKQLESKLKIGGATAVRDSIINTYNTLATLNKQFSAVTCGLKQQTYLYVLSDEEDNSSRCNQFELMKVIRENPDIHLNIIHISD